MLALSLAVWKVLASLPRHLVNSLSALSSWLEFVARPYLFGVRFPVVSLHRSLFYLHTKASLKTFH